MSEVYTIQGTTLNSLGDSVRNKIGQTKFITQTSDTADVDWVHHNGVGNGNYSMWGMGDNTEIEKTISGLTKVKLHISTVSTDEEIRFILYNGTTISDKVYEVLLHDGDGPIDLEFDGFNEYVETGVTAMYYTSYGTFSYTLEYYDADNNPVGYQVEVTNTMTPLQMASAIDTLPTKAEFEETQATLEATQAELEAALTTPPPPDNAYTLTGDCTHRFANRGWDWFIEQYGDKITTSGITGVQEMFAGSNVKEIPFDINTNGGSMHMTGMFKTCTELLEVPKIVAQPYAMDDMFQQCYKIRYLPDDFIDNLNWTYMKNLTSAYSGSHDSMFYHCYSLRRVPSNIFANMNPTISYSGSGLRNGWNQCCSLDEVVDLELPYTATWTSNAFDGTFVNCYRLKNFTFAMPDGQPYVMNWKNQTIDLSLNAGWSLGEGYTNTYILKYNSGITSDKCVSDDATYQALKDDPDWYTNDVAYSRFNHDSAVALINSLPDTSAYLATQTSGTNTVKFKGAAGEKTDGGAISTLTEEEIAVATAKGWTVQIV